MLIDNNKAMKKILIFTILLSLFLSCDKGKDCMNVPPSLSIIIVNNAVKDNRELLKSFENTENSAFLYKLIDNKKVKISYSPMANKNIKIIDDNATDTHMIVAHLIPDNAEVNSEYVGES